MFSTSAIVATFAAAAAALPAGLEARQSACTQFPWFIAPSYDATCTNAPAYQPASGPVVMPPPSTICAPLSQTPGESFPSVSVNPSSCPDGTYTVTLYTSPDCSDPGFVTTQNQNQCYPVAPGAANWIMFSATPNEIIVN